MDFIHELGLIFIVASLTGLVGRFLRLPIIVSYIIAGIIIGPNGFGLINDPNRIKELSTLGIVFLLFLVGIELNFTKLKEVGLASFVTVLFQTVLAIIGGYTLSILLGFTPTAAGYIGLSLAFNSTVIVIKSLTERHELDTLHGRMTVGVLLMQDAVAIAVLILLNGYNQTGSLELAGIIKILASGTALFVTALLISQYIFPFLFKQFAKSTELLTVSAIGWALLAALVANWLGFSIESGAFIAGVSIASLSYTTEITAKIRTLRDFFVAIFFVALGMTVTLSNIPSAWPIVFLTLGVLIGTPIIVTLILVAQGYKARTSLLTGLSLSQVGEFSLIIMALAYSLGQIESEIISLITLVTIISIILSSFIMNYAHFLTKILSPVIRLFEYKKHSLHVSSEKSLVDHVVVFGAHRIGQSVLGTLKKDAYLKDKIVVVDVNPVIVKQLSEKENFRVIYGDMLDPDILEETAIEKAQLVISTTPEFEANLSILQKIKKNHRRNTMTYLTAKNVNEALLLYDNGADYVILPQYLTAEYVSDLIENFDLEKPKLNQRKKHISELEKYLTSELKI